MNFSGRCDFRFVFFMLTSFYPTWLNKKRGSPYIGLPRGFPICQAFLLKIMYLDDTPMASS